MKSSIDRDAYQLWDLDAFQFWIILFNEMPFNYKGFSLMGSMYQSVMKRYLDRDSSQL